MRPRRGLSLRGKFIFIVLVGAVFPLALFGLWLTGTAERSAEGLLRARLDASMDQIVDQLGGRWLHHRSQLLGVCEDPAVQRALSEDPAAPSAYGDEAARRFGQLAASLRPAISYLALRDMSGTVRWAATDSTAASAMSLAAGPVFPVMVDVFDNLSGERRGTLEAHLKLAGLLPGGSAWGGVSGSVLAVFDPASRASLLPLSIDPALFERNRFVWAEEPWLTERRTLHEPALELALAAPLTPFVEPFEQAARRNLILLAVVAVGGFLLATLMSWPVTRALRQLATAADAVSRGELDCTVDETRSDEVGRVARAFNAMTESLQHVLRQLSQREALASVGEFAAALAHEVRNPLTSIRVDLQRLEETLSENSEAHALLGRALGQIERVDRSVTGALRLARSGQVESEPVDVRQPLAEAAHEAAPRFDSKGATVEPLELGSEPLWVKGNSAALEQLFLNLLLNAADALDDRGRAGIEVEEREGQLRVSVWDTGRGIAPEDLDRVFEAFYSTKPQGTGLGLAIAQRIALAHGGRLKITSTPGEGTRVELELPIAGAKQRNNMSDST